MRIKFDFDTSTIDYRRLARRIIAVAVIIILVCLVSLFKPFLFLLMGLALIALILCTTLLLADLLVVNHKRSEDEPIDYELVTDDDVVDVLEETHTS